MLQFNRLITTLFNAAVLTVCIIQRRMRPEKLQGFGGSECDLSQSTIPEFSWADP